MKNISNKIKATVAVAAVTSMATLINIPRAEAAVFELSWTGEQGYSALGRFSFDDSFLGSVVTNDQLNSFGISFFTPDGDVLKKFTYDVANLSSAFNFNFDTVTETVLQSGNFNTSTGFDLGDDFNTSLDGTFFYTFQDASQGLTNTSIYLNQGLAPETCIISGGCSYDFGGELTATVIPEPGVILGLIAIGSLTGYLKKKPASV
ncbi:MAG: PEP-CTERM sorting domain-containing protein [Nodularia sp. (in: Bacteria)]|nr:MAG: PEP-CTERM sorting domain-containing protein [Nodularia sp. (in: cyanobacteria)]